jgi:hypothetical protein
MSEGIKVIYNSNVFKIEQIQNYVKVYFLKNGKLKKLKAKYW